MAEILALPRALTTEFRKGYHPEMSGDEPGPESLSQILQDEGLDPARLRELLETIQPVDLADLLDDLALEDRVRILEILEPAAAAQVLAALAKDARSAIADRLGEARLKEVIEKMPADAVADILDHLPVQKETSVMMRLDRAQAREIEELRKYPENTAGGRMSLNFVAVPEAFTADETLKAIQGAVNAETIEYVYVVDESDHLRGVCSLYAILRAEPDTPVAKFMRREVTFVGAHLDQEEVARIAQKYNLRAIPVVDGQMKLLGVVTMRDILEVVHQEASEDIMKLAGAGHVHPIHAPFLARLKARIPWLAAAMVIELTIAWIMKGYESAGTLATLTLAYFIPVIMAMGGNVGLQSSTMVVRGLATGELSLRKGLRVVLAEFRVGIIIGVFAGAITGLMAMLLHRSEPSPHRFEALRIAAIVCGSMTTSITVAATMGAIMPFLLQRVKLDPAVASGPFITAINDAVNITLYLTLATVFILKTS